MSLGQRWVRVDVEAGGLRILTMQKPPVNALGRELVEDLTAALESLRDDEAGRCLILRSSGGNTSVPGPI